MNKVLLAVNVLLVAAVGFLFYKVNSDSSASEAAAPKKNAAAMPVTNKVAFFNADSLTKHYAYISEKQKTMEIEERRLTSAIEAELRNYQTYGQQLQAKAATMTPKEQEEAMMDLRLREQKIGEMREKAALDIQKMSETIQKELFSKLENFLKKYNEKQQFDYILKYTEGGPIAFGKEALDITTDIISGMNAEYEASKKK